MIDDEARFDRQRRNIQLVSVVVLFAYIFRVNLSNVSLLGALNIGINQITIVFFVLTSYFLIRFYQISETQEQSVIFSLHDNYLERNMQRTFEQKIRQEAEAVVKTGMGVKAIYDYKFYLSCGTVSNPVPPLDRSLYRGYSVIWHAHAIHDGVRDNFNSSTVQIIPHDSPEYKSMSRKAWVEAVLHNKLFTEYLLPYILGIAALGCLVFHIAILNMVLPIWGAWIVAILVSSAAAYLPLNYARRLIRGRPIFEAFS